MKNTQQHTKESAVFVINTINCDAQTDQFAVEGRLKHQPTPNLEAKLIASFDGNNLQPAQYNTHHKSYEFIIPADTEGKLNFFLLDGDKKSKLKLEFTDVSHLTGRHHDYRVIKNKILRPQDHSLIFENLSTRKLFRYETKFFIQSLRSNDDRLRYNLISTILVEKLRIAALVRPHHNRPEVWLFCDRTISGGDNSEVLFRYIADQKNKDIKPYFTVNRGTDAYHRLKKAGYRVVPFKSIKHLYLTMVADVLLPSHLEDGYLYPMTSYKRKYFGLLRRSVVHTQHGIVLNDMSDYIGKQAKNAQLFLSICEWEKKYLVSPKYGYSPEQVPVTGAPRYDELDGSDTRNIISLHPTWRSWLAPTDRGGERKYSETLEGSKYHKFYQSLINDERVLAALEQNNYTLKFYLHPNHRSNFSNFSTMSKNVQLMQFPYNYMEMFNESAVFVTDYSNTLFDFAYLKKPIIHTQFDSDTFFKNQTSISERLFNYEEEGFGPVTKDYESAVREIVKAIDSGAQMPVKYKERVDRFFTHLDRDNSKRAYEVLLRSRTGAKN